MIKNIFKKINFNYIYFAHWEYLTFALCLCNNAEPTLIVSDFWIGNSQMWIYISGTVNYFIKKKKKKKKKERKNKWILNK